MTKTKIVLATLLAFGFASTAFASDSGLDSFGQVPQGLQQQAQAGSAADAYAYAPTTTQKAGFSNAERREFNRVTADEISSH
ncbi:MAG: hypothetical protein WC670_11475 [Pseudolabrys sp.]|jgi:hypothetical protein